jgi:hypothetical protein
LPDGDPPRPGAKPDMAVLSPFAGQAALALTSVGRFSVLEPAPLETLAKPATSGGVVLAPRQPVDGLRAADTYVAGLNATFVALAVPQGNWEGPKAAQRSRASSRSAPPTALQRPSSLLSSPQSSPSPLMTGRIGTASTPPRHRGRLRSARHRRQGAAAVRRHDLSRRLLHRAPCYGLVARLLGERPHPTPSQVIRPCGGP